MPAYRIGENLLWLEGYAALPMGCLVTFGDIHHHATVPPPAPRRE